MQKPHTLLLSQCLESPEILILANEESVSPDAFEEYAEIYNELQRAYRDDTPHDMTSLALKFPKRMSEIIDWNTTITTYDSRALIREVKETYQCKCLNKAMVQVNKMLNSRPVFDDRNTWSTATDVLTKLIDDTCDSPSKTIDPSKNADAIKKYIEPGNLVSYKTGLESLDKLGGINPGYIALVARTSEGKSTLAMNIALGVMTDGARVLYFSEEMPRPLLLTKMAAITASMNFSKDIAMGKMDESQREELTLIAEGFSHLPLYVNSNCLLDYNRVEAEIKRLYSQAKINFVILDYIQQFRLPFFKGSRFEELRQISSRILSLTTQLDIPFIVCAQLNREHAKQEIDWDSASWKTDVLHQIRDCGSIEQDAKQVIHIGKFVDEQQQVHRFINVAKDRLGRVGTFRIQWNMETGEIR